MHLGLSKCLFFLTRAQIKSALKKKLHEQDTSSTNAQKTKNKTQSTTDEPQTKKRKPEGIAFNLCVFQQLILNVGLWETVNMTRMATNVLPSLFFEINIYTIP